MSVFFLLLFKILPLYFLILLGFIAGKNLNAKKESIAPILIYIITPVIVFNSILKTDMQAQYLFLPITFFCCCTIMCLVFYKLGAKLFPGNNKNVIALSAGTGNTGYFGIPVCIELLGDEYVGFMVLGIIGFTVFENTIGFFTIAKGHHSADEAIKRVLKLPTIYAFLLGLLFNFMNLKLGRVYDTFAGNFIGAYAILGMMMIGLGLADLKSLKMDYKFLSVVFVAKFIIWPLISFTLIYLDRTFFHLFNEDIYKMAVLISIVPLAANLVAFATEFKTQPNKASAAVFISTIFALFYIPLVTGILF